MSELVNALPPTRQLFRLFWRIRHRSKASVSLQPTLRIDDSSRWRSLIAAAPAVVHTWRPSGDYATIFVSDNVTELLGYAPDEFLKASAFWLEHLHPDDRRRILDGLATPPDQGRHACEYRFRHKNGAYVWLREECRSLRDKNGQPSEIVGCIFDITDLKETESALRRSDARYRDLLDMHPDPVFIDRNNRIAYANAAALKLFGAAKQEELIGKRTLELVHPESMGTALSRLRALRTPGVVVPLIEEKMLRLDGTVIDVEVLASAFRDDGATAFHVVLRDLSESKRKQRMLEASSTRLRQLTRTLESVREEEQGRLARELHDELGQLLTALSMDAAWIRRHTPETDADIRERASAMIDLIKRIGEATTRIATRLRPRVLDDLGLVAAIRSLAEETSTRCGIACEVTVGDEGLVVPDSLATPLFRMAQEALTNVARHSEATSVSLTLEQEDGELCLSVSDNGQGLAEHDLKKDRSYGLLGMRERAAAIGGEMKITSAPGAGTTIKIYVPFPPAASTSR